ncbi:MAG: hypothetical protein K6E30_02775 [Lachnospiraceae bacterium]|nr:hypothetical protein [Lachnospiraceae bacterium]
MRRIKRKLKSSSGESIVEVLVALLISALALTMLAGMVTASQRIITRSEQVLKAYYSSENALEKFDSNGAVRSVAAVKVEKTEATGDVSIKRLKEDEDTLSVYVYTNNTEIGGRKVASYQLKTS